MYYVRPFLAPPLFVFGNILVERECIYKLYYAMLKNIKMIMLRNNVLYNTMYALFPCKCIHLFFSSFE